MKIPVILVRFYRWKESNGLIGFVLLNILEFKRMLIYDVL